LFEKGRERALARSLSYKLSLLFSFNSARLQPPSDGEEVDTSCCSRSPYCYADYDADGKPRWLMHREAIFQGSGASRGGNQDIPLTTSSARYAPPKLSARAHDDSRGSINSATAS